MKVRNQELENQILQYIMDKPDVDMVDVTCQHPTIRVDITLESLQQLVDDGKVVRRHIFGTRYGYVITDTAFNTDI